MDRIDNLFETSKRNMPECTLTAQAVLERNKVSKKAKRAWVPFVAFPAIACLICAIVLPLTLRPASTDGTIEAFPSGAFGDSGPIPITQTWYVGLRTTALPKPEKKVQVYYGYSGAMDMEEYWSNPYFEIDGDQDVILSIRRDIYEYTESEDRLVASDTVTEFESTLGEAMQTRDYFCTPYTIQDDGSYGFGRYEREPFKDNLVTNDFLDSTKGMISYTFGIEPKSDETLHYRDKNNIDAAEPESLGFYYDTNLQYEIDKEGNIELSVIENYPRPDVYVRLVLEKVPYSDLVVRLALYPSKGSAPILVEYPSKELLLFAYDIPRSDDVALILAMVKDAEHQRNLYFDPVAREDMERTSAMEMARNAIDRCIDGLHKAHMTARLEGKKCILAALETWMKKMDSDDGQSIKPTKPIEVGGKKK